MYSILKKKVEYKQTVCKASLKIRQNKPFFNAIFHFLTKNEKLSKFATVASSGLAFHLQIEKKNPIQFHPIQLSI